MQYRNINLLGLLSLFLFTMPLAGRDPGAAIEVRPVPFLSGAGYETRDLGAVAGKPGFRRYQTRLGVESQVELTGPEKNGGEFVWRFPGGETVRWLPLIGAEEMRRAPDAGLMVVGGNEKSSGTQGTLATGRWRGAAPFLEAALPRDGRPAAGRLRLSAGLSLQARAAPVPSQSAPLQIMDARGLPLLNFASGGNVLTAQSMNDSGTEFTIRYAVDAAAAGSSRTGAPDELLAAQSFVVTVTLGPVFGGYVCRGDSFFDGDLMDNPTQNILIGRINRWYGGAHCLGYMSWNGAVIPRNAIITKVSASLSVAGINFSGPSPVQIGMINSLLHPYPVNAICPPDPYDCYQNQFGLNYYNEFTSNPIYAFPGFMSVGVNGSYDLGATAVYQFQTHVRGANPWFMASLLTPQFEPPDTGYLISPTGSVLEVEYELPPPEVALQRIRFDAAGARVDLYNYGDDFDLTGWLLAGPHVGGGSGWGFPAGTIIKRHQFLQVIDAAGTNSLTTIYTGGGLFNFATPAPVASQLALAKGAGATDTVCWGAYAPAPPFGAGWYGACAPLPVAGDDLHRNRVSDTDTSADWTATSAATAPAFYGSQYGTRRHADLLIDQVLVQPSLNWLKLVNLGPDTNLQNWSLVFWPGHSAEVPASGTYSFGDTPLLSGQTIWLAEGTGTFYSGSSYGNTDNWHRNLGFDLNFDNTPKGGEILLRDAGGKPRDYFVFGTAAPQHNPADMPWLGAPAGLGVNPNPELRRETDLNSNAAGDWVAGGFSSLAVWGVGVNSALNPNQQGPTRRQDTLGGGGTAFTNPGGAGGSVGNGAVLNVTQQVAIEEFAIEANPAAGPRNGILVIKKLGSGSLLFSRSVSGIAAGTQVIRSGRINPPITLNPGTYAVMLYLDGAWADNERFNSTERLAFGTNGGVTTEPGFTPSPAIGTTYANYALHSWLSTVDPPTVTNSTPLPGGAIGAVYNFAHTVGGGFGGPWTWTLSAGSLPSGLTLNASGTLTGTPSTGGTYYFQVKVTDAAGLEGFANESLAINPALSVATATLPPGNVSYGYNATLAAGGGVGPFTWLLDNGLLPPGINLSSGGSLSGTPTTAGTYNFTVRVTDTATTVTATRALSIQIFNAPPLSGSAGSTSLSGEEGRPFAATFTASGGVTPYTWSVTGGQLPPGISLDGATGQLSGTPTGPAIASLTYRLSDSAGQTLDFIGNPAVNYRIRIYPRLRVANAFLPDYTGDGYKVILAPYGGVPAITWSCAIDPALIGLSCSQNPDGYWELSGTLSPAVADGNYPVSLTATDSYAIGDSRPLTLRVDRALAILTSTLPAATLGFDYGQARLLAKGGRGVSLWSVSSGVLPPGLALNTQNGWITGTPATLGIYPFTATYSNDGGRIDRVLSITVADPVVPPYWVRRGLSGGYLYPVFSPGFALDKTVLGISGRLLYISQDSGFFWRQLLFPSAANSDGGAYAVSDSLSAPVTAPGFDGRPVSDPARPPGANHMLVVARPYSGIWYTDDLGLTWTQLNTNLAARVGAPYVYTSSFFFAPDFATSKKIYTVSWSNLYKNYALFSAVLNTAAKTASWSVVSPQSLNFSTSTPPTMRIWYSPDFANDNAMYTLQRTRIFYTSAYVAGTALWRSTDGGVSWSQLSVLPIYGSSGSAGLRFSRNFAADRTFSLIDGNFDPNTGLITANGFYLTHDAGATFVQRAAGHVINDVQFPADYNPSTRPVFYMAEPLDSAYFNSQINLTDDDGVNFRVSGTGGMTQDLFGGSFSLSPDFVNDRLILANGNGSPGLFRSTDAGATWGPSDSGVDSLTINTVAHAPDYATSGAVFLGTYQGIHFTINRGRTWKQARLPRRADVKEIVVSPDFANDRKVFAYACQASTDCQVLRSADGGENFTEMSQQTAQVYLKGQFRISPNFANDRMLFLTDDTYDPVFGYEGSALLRSTDEGRTFTPQANNHRIVTYGVSPGFATDQTIYSFGYDTVNYTESPLKSVNGANPDAAGGATLQPFNYLPTGSGGYYDYWHYYQPPVFTSVYNQLTGVNGAASRTFFWDCKKSVNGGASFSAFPATGSGCVSADYYRTLGISPAYATDNTLFASVRFGYSAGQTAGLYKSTDGGNNFSPLTIPGNPTAFSAVNQISLSPVFAVDGEAVVATDKGLFITTDRGVTWRKASGTEAYTTDITAVTQEKLRRGGVFVGTGAGLVYQSVDDGQSAEEITSNLPTARINSLLTTGTVVTRLLAATALGIYTRTDFTENGFWSLTGGGNGDIRSLVEAADSSIYAARADGRSLRSVDGGVTWVLLGSTVSDALAIDFNSQTGPTLEGPDTDGGKSVSGTGAALWAASGAGGARWSADNGTNWTAAPGGNDYTLPALTGTGAWSAVKALGLNAGAREVMLGNNGLDPDPTKRGLFMSRDGGDSWRRFSGAGSGLEATSLNVSAFLTATTAYATTDLLVGINGTTNGGVYLSGDGGEHWTQINQGFDPNNLSISSLVKTSCSGCPVQYYSGSYGSGVYTRTITVNAPPSFPGVNRYCFGPTCTGSLNNCANGAISGPVSGGQAFKLCGGNFQAGAAVELGGIPAIGCVIQSASVITCTTPPHAAGLVTIRVRNPDTRAGNLPTQYTYSGGSSRGGNSLRVAKSGANANLTWTCSPACTAGNPARIYRGQNGLLTLYPENYNGGTGTSYSNTGAVSTAQSYFWSVE